MRIWYFAMNEYPDIHHKSQLWWTLHPSIRVFIMSIVVNCNINWHHPYFPSIATSHHTHQYPSTSINHQPHNIANHDLFQSGRPHNQTLWGWSKPSISGRPPMSGRSGDCFRGVVCTPHEMWECESISQKQTMKKKSPIRMAYRNCSYSIGTVILLKGY